MIELNRSRNNVVLSRRAVLEEERKDQRQQILDKLQPGDVVEGQISNIVDFGAFVDLNGMDGLIHISELSWSHVNHPSEVLEIGQTVQVKVLDIDRDRQRISLGLKQTQSDPWQQVLENYAEDDVVEGRVTKVVTFGAFVEILPGVEGLVHISELAQHHVENPREVVAQGQPVNVKIIEVDGERRRLSLSLKRVEDTDPVQPRADGGESVHLRPGSISPKTSSQTTRTRRRRRADAPPSRSDGRRGRRGSGRGEPEAADAEPRQRPQPRGRARRGRARGRGARGSDGRGRRDRRRRRAVADDAARGDRRRRCGAGSRRSERVSRPVAVAITGGIGAGKSEALQRIRAARRRDRLERRDRPPAAAARGGAATRSSSASGNGVLAPGGEIDRGALGDGRLQRPRRARLARGAAAPARRRPSTCTGARSSAALPDAAARLRDRGAAPLRGRRRRALRQGRRDHGADEAPARALGGRRPTSASRGCSPTRRRSRAPTTRS